MVSVLDFFPQQRGKKFRDPFTNFTPPCFLSFFDPSFGVDQKVDQKWTQKSVIFNQRPVDFVSLWPKQWRAKLFETRLRSLFVHISRSRVTSFHFNLLRYTQSESATSADPLRGRWPQGDSSRVMTPQQLYRLIEVIKHNLGRRFHSWKGWTNQICKKGGQTKLYKWLQYRRSEAVKGSKKELISMNTSDSFLNFHWNVVPINLCFYRPL